MVPLLGDDEKKPETEHNKTVFVMLCLPNLLRAAAVESTHTQT